MPRNSIDWLQMGWLATVSWVSTTQPEDFGWLRSGAVPDHSSHLSVVFRCWHAIGPFAMSRNHLHTVGDWSGGWVWERSLVGAWYWLREKSRSDWWVLPSALARSNQQTARDLCFFLASWRKEASVLDTLEWLVWKPFGLIYVHR